MSNRTQQDIIPNVHRTVLTTTIATALSRHGSRIIDLQASLTGPETYTVTITREIPLRWRLAAASDIIDADQIQAGQVVV